MTAPEPAPIPPESPPPRGRMGPGRVIRVTALFLLLALVSLCFSLLVGDTAIDYGVLFQFDSDTVDYQKVFRHRLPRALAAMIVGGGLTAAALSLWETPIKEED